MKYRNIKNGIVAELVSKDDKFKTVTLRINGDEKPYSSSTIKRWWEPVVEEEEKLTTQEFASLLGSQVGTAEEKEISLQEELFEEAQVQEVVSEDICADGTPYSEIGKEIAQQAQDKAKMVHQKRDTSKIDAFFKELCAICEGLGYTLLTYEKLPRLAVVKNGKRSEFEFRVTFKGFKINCRPNDIPEEFGKKYDHYLVNNYYMPATFVFADFVTTPVIEMLDAIVQVN